MQFKKEILSNGLRLVTIPMKDNPTVTVMVLVEAGSKYESKKISGTSHFLEHMCFKGTTKRPKPIDIVRELDGHGAQYNAFTGQEMTGYYAKAASQHFDTILDVVSDIYLNSVFPEAEIEKEKGVIVEEIKMYNDLPNKHVSDVLLKLLYGEQPAGWDVAGTEKTVRSFKRDDFVDYKHKHYVSGATTVVVAGDINEEKVKKAVEKAFANAHTGKKHPKTAVKDEQKKPAILIEYKKTDQVHLLFGIRTFDAYHKDNAVMRVLSGILGGGMSSRLFQKLRDELGICYYVNAGNNGFTDHGFFEVGAGVPMKRLPEALTAILVELRSLKEKPVSSEELARVKEYLTGNLFLTLESSDSVAEFFGYQEILRKPVRGAEAAAAEVRAVTAEDVHRVAQRIFVDKHLNLALIGELKDDKPIRSLLTLA